ncbi:hypothetical protein EOPP23_18670 [Endozoicomonas sp. OPT23]|uniref:tetratricopeptide repeat protein n=1 Tax=Endozoicomonas sp. OPT23 TaxID=2072845 RepID=UPI00129B7EF4|nr:hypothetical protein [Endozoicomonas sp. OPT23]MRI35003.1 hypothetical protein [Endozoicomonas sp. OPT23]
MDSTGSTPKGGSPGSGSDAVGCGQPKFKGEEARTNKKKPFAGKAEVETSYHTDPRVVAKKEGQVCSGDVRLTMREKAHIDSINRAENALKKSSPKVMGAKWARCSEGGFVYASEAEEEYGKLFGRCIELLRSNGDSMELRFVRMQVFYHLKNYSNLEKMIAEVLEKDAEDPLMCARAYCLKAKSLLRRTNRFTDESAELFRKAFELGLPEAGIYYAQASIGLSGDLSWMKWCDSLKTVQITSQMAGLQKVRVRELVLARSKMASDSKDSPHRLYVDTQCCNEQSIFHEFPSNEESAFAFALYLLFREDKSELQSVYRRFEKIFISLRSKKVNADQLKALYLYARVEREGYSANLFDQLKAVDHFTAFFLCGYLLLKSRRGSLEEAKEWFDKASEIPQSFLYKAEIYLSRKQFSEAQATYYQAMDRLMASLTFDATFFESTWFHQAGCYFLARLDGTSTQKELDALRDHADEIVAQGKKSTFSLMLGYEIRAEFLEEMMQTGLKNTESDGSDEGSNESGEESDSDSDGSQEADVFQNTAAVVAKLGDTGSVTVEADDVVTDNSDSGEAWIQVRHVKRSTKAIRRILTKANTLLAEAKSFEEVGKLLDRIEAKEGTSLWFRTLQSRNWLVLQRAMQCPEGKEQDRLVREAVSMANHGIELLEKKVVQPSLKTKKEVKKAKALTDEERVMSTAEQLEVMAPSFRRQYGGLYSVLGHSYTLSMQTSKDEKTKGQNEALKKHNYHLADLIRGREEYKPST